jgi:hypothetical protein
MQLPSIQTYGNYSSSNYGAHCLQVVIGHITVWFSYTTPIAFKVGGNGRVVRQNDWSTTTGKHLNAIDNGGTNRAAKRLRVDSQTFERLWAEQVEPALAGV